MIRSIQYLRAIAALSVVWLHALSMMTGFTDVLGPPRFGGSGVDLFFVISGFIMLVTTHEKPIRSGEFFALRIIRVVPLYWFTTLLMVGCATFIPGTFRKLQFSGTTLIESLLFIPYEHGPVLAPGWTLNYELFFYAIFALSLSLPKRLRLPGLFLCLTILVLTGYVLHPGNPILRAYTSAILLEFLAGSIIAYAWIHQKLRIGLTVSLLAIGTGMFLLFPPEEASLFGHSHLVGATLVVAGCLHPAIRGIKNRLFLSLGNASYSIYLTHLFVLAALRVVWMRLVPGATLEAAYAFMALALAGSSAGGWICYRVIERPMTTRLQKLVKRERIPAALPEGGVA